MPRAPHPRLRTVVRTAATVLAAFGLVTGVPSLGWADQTRDDQWQLRALDARAAWAESTGAGVIVAVLDSGVDANHPDLVGQVLPGIDLVGRGSGRADPVGHGTAVAAFIAGRGDDGNGVVG
ncbi:MAG TPA: S8 family serine peptidase, partial [Micromonosporaceae bacterium]|nr:S8 family serine peptidase [Micromonosporaceae bacterium]